ncbi:EamA family transporter RarD [Pseudoblastomonas halimionae]|uniref:EamA family transporter RarD n=1 Tax=Alteriqipengyuania halimionae TaxID=1926630 RepID=A0A6I4TYJ3_9SPHN|nr:EamA family transporter RarD [Alteriqipengyuania halimionae]MXP08730.1 EamA family transporter RarD [Alteriqipengyuania halimionae]
MSTRPSEEPGKSGLPAALAAYILWGLMPIYLLTVKTVPAVEFVGWRILWTIPICLLLVTLRKQLGEVAAILRNRRAMLVLMGASALIAINWIVYVLAIQQGNVYAASLGYYINPLVNVFLGTVVLGERMSRRLWIAVALAGVGVAILLAGALTTLWISLTLALSFGTYGLLKKTVQAGALPGLTVESMLLALPAAGACWYYAQTPAGSAFTQSTELSAWIMLGGALTAIPLTLFAVAARRMDYSSLGFIQFLAPTMVFILGLTVFDQPLQPVQLASFGFIWAALALFVWELWRGRKKAPLPPKAAASGG